MLNEPCAMIWMNPVTLGMDTLLARYYHPETLKALCTVCGNYGRNYACPPLSLDVEQLLRRYPHIHLLAARLMISPDLRKESLDRLFVRGMDVFNRALLACEAADEGSLAVAPGHCTLCKRCARHDGLPCLQPERLRLSLDAFSLEIARMASDLFHFEIQWYQDQPPEYLTMIGGLLSFRGQAPHPPEADGWMGKTVALRPF